MMDLTIHGILLSFFICVYLLDDQCISGGAANTWDYDGLINPSRWALLYPQCAGNRQSPVDINTNNIVFNRNLRPIRFIGYNNIRNVRTSLQNNGHTVEVDLTGRPITIRGGGLPGTYRVQQFHFHWGANDRRGSEHSINTYHYPMEMHIVHYSTRYRDYQAAQTMPNGLAVLAFFFRVGRYNPNFEEIVSHLDDIRFRGDQVPLQSFPLSTILPRNVRNFYRYKGSLTTPPCYESVIWTVFKTPEEISESQLNRFRFLVNENFPNQTNDKISDDFRPVQPLNGRRICSSDPQDYNPSLPGRFISLPRRFKSKTSLLRNRRKFMRNRKSRFVIA